MGRLPCVGATSECQLSRSSDEFQTQPRPVRQAGEVRRPPTHVLLDATNSYLRRPTFKRLKGAV